MREGGWAFAGCTSVLWFRPAAPSLVCSPGSGTGAEVSACRAGCKEPPPLAPVFPGVVLAKGLSCTGWSWVWDRSRGHRLPMARLRATVPWKQVRQSGLGVGAERG